jgi:hypothetical protein
MHYSCGILSQQGRRRRNFACVFDHDQQTEPSMPERDILPRGEMPHAAFCRAGQAPANRRIYPSSLPESLLP